MTLLGTNPAATLLKKTHEAEAARSGSINWNFVVGKEGGNWLVGYVPNVKNKNGNINSGVTILFGYDLGQQTPSDVKSLHLTKELEHKLLPFCGLKGSAALLALESQKKLAGFAIDILDKLNNRGSTAGIQPLIKARHETHQGKIVTAQYTTLDEKNIISDRQQNVTASSNLNSKDKSGLILTKLEAEELSPKIKLQYYKRLCHIFDKQALKHKKKIFSTLDTDRQTALMSLFWSGHWPLVGHDATSGNWNKVIDSLKKCKDDAARRRHEAALIARGAGIALDQKATKTTKHIH